MGDDAPRKLVPEVEGLHGRAALELVHALTDAADGRVEALHEVPARAVVVAVREQDLARRPVLGEPVEALGRRDRVDQSPLRRKVVRMNADLDTGMRRRPMPDARNDLLHGRERSAEENRPRRLPANLPKHRPPAAIAITTSASTRSSGSFARVDEGDVET